jgi:hypothetical protein
VNLINHFELNRPVHLARRDVYFEKAAERISAQLQQVADGLATEAYEEILYMLRTARLHARFSIRDAGKNGHNEQFSLFINLLAGNVKAVLSMINLRGMVEGAQNSSFSFLGVNQASAGLQAEEYHRRACDIVRSMQNTLNLAQEPFENLKAKNREAATDEENARYHKARDHFWELVSKTSEVQKLPPVLHRFMRA